MLQDPLSLLVIAAVAITALILPNVWLRRGG